MTARMQGESGAQDGRADDPRCRWRLAHLGYVVQSMDGALKRFVREGAVVVIPPRTDLVQKVECCLVNLPGDVPVELIAPVDEQDCPIRRQLNRGGGLDHICYHVDVLEKALEVETACGSLVVCPPCEAAVFGERIAFVQRRSGLVVELMTHQQQEAGA